MEMVGSALHHHVHDGATVVAELGREAVVLHVHFLHALNQGLVVDVGIPSFALLRRADQGTVQPYLGGGVALPVGSEVRSRWIVVLRARPCHLVTPAARNVRPKKLRLMSGSSCTYSLVMFVPRVALSVSSRGAVVVTSIDSLTRAGDSVKLSVVSWSTAKTTFVRSDVRKPLDSAFTEYVEGRSPVKTYSPLPSVMVWVAMLVPLSVIVTVAFGNTAPAASETTPRSCER